MYWETDLIRLAVHTAGALNKTRQKPCLTKLPREVVWQSCLIKHIQNGGRNENLRKSLGAQRNPPLTWEVGRREYPAPVKIMHKKKPYMARNCGTSSSCRLYEDRDDGSCMQDTNWHPDKRSFKDEYAETGNATPKKKPAFFHEVDELLSDKPCTKSKVIIKSATSATITLVVRCERDDQLNMFN